MKFKLMKIKTKINQTFQNAQKNIKIIIITKFISKKKIILITQAKHNAEQLIACEQTLKNALLNIKSMHKNKI